MITLGGQVVPKSQRPVFFGTYVKLQRWANRLETLRMEMQEMADSAGAEELDIRFISKQLESARRKVVSAMPFSRCDCRVFERLECKRCQGRGWLSAKQALKSSE